MDDESLDSQASVDEGLGGNEEHGEMDSPEQGSLAKESDPLAIKKRLGQQAKKHARETRALRDELAGLRAQLQPQNQNPQMQQQAGDEDQIQRAVRLALQAKEDEARKMEEAKKMEHVHQQYANLNDQFDKASEKYDDFDDVVRGNNVPFTNSMRDALLLVDNPADVAYKLGKNKDELQRISQLHPLDQAREINKLSFALMGGEKASSAQSQGSNKVLGQSKPNPVVNSSAYNPSAIRARMKAGTWK